MPYLILGAAIVAMWAFNRWVLKPDGPSQPVPATAASLPRATFGDPVPIVYGRQRVTAPTVIWQGQLRNEAIVDGNGDTVGFIYKIPFQLAVCIAGGDFAELLSVYYGAQQMFTGYFGNKNLDTLATIPNHTIFGGYWYGGSLNERPGATDGTFPFVANCDFNYTRFKQVFGLNGGDTTLLPDYRGIAWFAAFSFPTQDQTSQALGGWNLGDTAQPPPYSFEVRADIFDFGLAPIGDDANPAAVIYDLLTNSLGRGGLDSSLIDSASFAAAGATLDTEQHGCSLTLYNASTINDTINELLKQIGGVRYQDPETGKIGIKLIRGDYSPVGLDEYSDALGNVISVEQWATGAWADTINMVRVVYRDRALGYKDNTVAEPDLGNFQIQGAFRAATYRYPFCCTYAVAQQIAAREIVPLAQPLRKARLMLNRQAHLMKPGDVFKFTWSEFAVTDLIFRVTNVDRGTLADGRIAVDVVEDVFGRGFSTVDIPPHPFNRFTPQPIIERVFTEAPRWLALQAQRAGRVTDADTPHPLYLAVPVGHDDSMQPELSSDGLTFVNDGNAVSFVGRGTVETAYARTLDPHDGSTGLRIKDVDGAAAFTTMTAADIRALGANLALVGKEVIGFLSATLSGGIWTLHDVYRGLLDTVPVDHAIGERIYFLSASAFSGLLTRVATNTVGSAGLASGATVYAKLVPLTQGAKLSPESDQPTDSITVVGRPSTPYPVAALTLNGTNAPTALEEEGQSMAWAMRDRLSSTIVLGSDGSELPEASTTISVLGAKLRDNVYGASLLDGPLSVSTPTDPTSATRLNFATVGYGDIAAQVKSTLSGLDNWQTPSVLVHANEWRNLLLNPRFDDGVNSWTVTAGNIDAGNTAAKALGGGGHYVENTVSVATDPDFYQIVDITGFEPGNLTANLTFYGHNDADTDDTLKVELISLKADGTTVLQTQTYGPTAQSTTQWNYNTLTISALDTQTAKLKVHVVLGTVAGLGPGNSKTKATEFRLRVGQMGSQLLSNPEFESGLTSWTTVSGGFDVITTGQLYTGAQYIRGGDFASSELKQEVNVPAGYNFASAVFECARMNDAASDTGQVILEALDGGGSVLYSAQTAAEAISPLSAWVRRRIYIPNIGLAVKVRVRLLTTRVTSPNANTCFDDCSLRLHKHLDTDQAKRWRFDVPVAQPMPRDANQFEVAYVPATTSAAPDLFMYDGTSVASGLGPGGDLRADASIVVLSKFVGPISDATNLLGVTNTCFESLPSNTTDDLHATDPTLANFATADAWSVWLMIRGNYPNGQTAASGLCGRMDTTGWSLSLTSAGLAKATIIGTGGTKTVTGGIAVSDGATQWVAIVHDGSTLHIMDPFGDATVSTSGVGEIKGAAATLLRLFRSKTSETPFHGQIARAWGFKRALTYTEASALFTHGSDPTGDTNVTYSRGNGQTLSVPVGTDGAGILLGRYVEAQVPLEWRTAAHTGGATGWMLASQATVTNATPDQDVNAGSNWSSSSGGVITGTYVQGPEGIYNAVQLAGSSLSDWRRLSSIVLGAGNVTVVLPLRATTGTPTIEVELTDSAGAHSHNTSFALTTSWALYTMTITWDAATAQGRMNIYPHPSGGGSTTIQLGAPIFIGQTSGVVPEAYASRGNSSSTFAFASAALTGWEQANHEGEIEASVVGQAASPTSGTLANLWNGSTDHDRRRLRINGSSQAELVHYDGAGASTAAAVAETWNAPVRERGRWCLADLIEHPASFSRVVNAGGAGEGRASAWTPSSAGGSLPAQIDIGNADLGDGATLGIVYVTLFVREPRIAVDDTGTQTVP